MKLCTNDENVSEIPDLDNLKPVDFDQIALMGNTSPDIVESVLR